MKRNFYGAMFTGAVLTSSAALIGGCADMHTQTLTCPQYDETKDVTVKIEFENKCPMRVDCDLPDVSKTKRIIWQASDSDGTTPEYEIYFDPFKGHPIKSENRAEKKSPPFDNSSPKVEYKYTIVGTMCKEKPLDPRFRLR